MNRNKVNITFFAISQIYKSLSFDYFFTKEEYKVFDNISYKVNLEWNLIRKINE